MLILSRKAGDAIVIDGGIRIVVVQCDRGGVRIGIEAPADTTILRAELVDQVAAQNARASVTSAVAAVLLASGGALAPKRAASRPAADDASHSRQILHGIPEETADVTGARGGDA